MEKIINGIVKVFVGLSLIAVGTAGHAQLNSAGTQREQRLRSGPAEQPPLAQSATAAKQAANPALTARQSATSGQPEDQIQINTYVIEVSSDDGQLGAMHWGNTLGLNGATFAVTSIGRSAPNSTFSQNPGGAFFKSGLILQASAVKASIRALIQRGKLKLINQPVTYTRSGEAVPIRSVQQQTMFLQTGAPATTPYTFSTGLTIDVLPRILEGGLIELKINPVLSAQTGASPAQQVSSPAIPIISTMSATADVRIRSAEAAVIGGIAPVTDNGAKDGIPAVRNNSLLGSLLGIPQKMTGRTNLVIIVSPKIVKRAALKHDNRVGADEAWMAQNLTDLPGIPAPIPSGHEGKQPAKTEERDSAALRTTL